MLPKDPRSISHDVAQGNFVDHRSIENPSATFPIWVRMVVLDVIFDPHIIDDVKIDYWEHVLKVNNIRIARVLPRNTIIAQRIFVGSSPSSDNPVFVYPMMTHLNLPCKAGEHVWVMFENPTSELGFWMCRIAEPHIIDDINHTHSPRQFDASLSATNKDTFDGTGGSKHEFRNGITDSANGERYSRGSTQFIPGSEDEYEKLMTESDAGRITVHEPVPRIRKRPADLVIEGSNNASITIGTDRSGPVAKYEQDETRGSIPKPTEDIQGTAGSIDMVTGRGETQSTGGHVVTSTKLAGGDFKKELAKTTKELVPSEGDPDYKNDRSRVLISQKTKVDANFSIANFNTKTFDISDADDGSGAIVLKSDKIRLIARQDLEIMVSGFATTNGKIADNDDASKYASIVLKSDGTIILKPADHAVLKLGGEDANLAVLTAPAITGVNDKSGIVTAPPQISSMGGSIGAGPGNAQFSTKVLLK